MPSHSSAKGDVIGGRIPSRTVSSNGEALGPNLPGRHPDEVLANIADSNLVPGMTLATIGTFLLMMACTIGPYYLGQTAAKTEEPAPAEKPAASESPAQTTPPATATAATTDRTEATPSVPKSSEKPISADALKKLDVDEVKSSPNDINPLEGSSDDLLKDLK